MSASIETMQNIQQKYAVIDAAGLGDNTLVGLVAGSQIRVTSFFLVGAAAVNIRFESNAGGTALTGIMTAGTNILSSGYNPAGHFETVAGELLNLELSGAVQVSGSLTYLEV